MPDEEIRLALEWRPYQHLVGSFELCTCAPSYLDEVETAEGGRLRGITPMFLSLLPFLGSGFVPTETMPAGLRTFAEYQPFTPIIETLCGLLLGSGIGTSAITALAWCAGISLVSYLWAKRKYNQRATR